MEIHLPRLIPGVLCIGAGLFGNWLIVRSVRGEYAILGVVLATAVILYGLRLIWV